MGWSLLSLTWGVSYAKHREREHLLASGWCFAEKRYVPEEEMNRRLTAGFVATLNAFADLKDQATEPTEATDTEDSQQRERRPPLWARVEDGLTLPRYDDADEFRRVNPNAIAFDRAHGNKSWQDMGSYRRGVWLHKVSDSAAAVTEVYHRTDPDLPTANIITWIAHDACGRGFDPMATRQGWADDNGRLYVPRYGYHDLRSTVFHTPGSVKKREDTTRSAPGAP